MARPLLNLGRLIHRHRQTNRERQAPARPYYSPSGAAESILQNRGDLDGALARHQQSEGQCRENGDKEGLAYALGSQALILQEQGDLSGAMSLHQKAERIYSEIGNRDGVVVSRQNQARILHDREDLDDAMVLLKDAERLCRELHNKVGLSYSLSSQAMIYQERGDLATANDLHIAAQRLYRDLRDPEGLAASIEQRATIVQDRADFDAAITLYEEAESVYRELGNKDGAADSLQHQAKLLRESRDLDRTLELLALLLFAFRAEARQLNFVPYHGSGIYRLGEKAGWTVSLPTGLTAPATPYAYEISKNNRETIRHGTLHFESGSAVIEATLEEPAMLFVTVTEKGAPPASAVHLGAAIAPLRLQPSESRPNDFDSFWDGKLQELSRIPLNPVVTPLTAKDGVELGKVQVDAWGSRAHGYLAKPAQPGKFPALVNFQYAGVNTLRPSTAIRRAAEGWLAFDVVSHDLPPDKASGVPNNYEVIGNTDREMCYFLKMYLRDARALDYITNRPDWDGKTLVLMGTCMGGQQALVSAALRPQVTAVIANQPSGANYHAGYPYWPSENPLVRVTARYFDVVNFAPRIKAPVLASMGFVDTTSPPAGIWTVLNQLSGPKEVVTMIELDHTSRTPERRGAFRSRVEEVLATLLRGGTFRPNQ